ncbi:nicotinate-nucleotide adenylyltransferase [Xanthomonas citri]|uniref:nicotinate-nucleotide adenylyltransferase n=1 Tax=Xanthomonas citri TaxID=346 RepID=UPI000247D222|nr:nicotinate-nucleotide adenylyltransferase [Xanthomonas citri]MBE0315085.1 nicotinate-nucleotide adenylyltransferase [Xanthomonas citri pv. punicae]MDS0760943.1 nicotinate-nucleotide adenylyltransferase [Xanthomonas citri pv. punicae]MDS0764721.1 nicotinate-nucleotide adenylyltransferase [Xanthomonas citri pv. punicae]MDS0799484.1 nicotinate-nucleotide adenylyltransferase [Xanthomonas citri pv. punicae]MDS0832127.1 nicotinate-nucleotide adenylyltransferase [Xanthomonas citri pv. punicae]
MKARDAGTRDPGPGSREGQGDRQRAHSDQLAQASPAISASGSQEQQRSHPDHVADPGSSDSRIPNPDSQLHLYYGGTFDPIHLGHLAIACAARDELGACVRLVPAADPPHRPAPGATATQRAQMLKLALANDPGLQLDTRELQRAAHCNAPSYTVDTLRELRAELGPAAPIAWLLGADAFAGLHHWHQWEALFGLAHFVVAARPGTPLTLADAPQLATAVQGRWVAGAGELVGAPAGRLYLLHQPLRGESASAVRSRIATGAQWQSLVPPPVAGMIQREGLYRSVRPAT